MIVVPDWFAAGVIVSVRGEVAPVSTRFPFGTSVVFDEESVKLTDVSGVSGSS